jgi:glycosyltransferase involved in cell wall biosynthesis
MMVLIGKDFPPDIRVEKEARALLAAGYQVTVVCENRKNRGARNHSGCTEIIRLPRLPLWLRRINTGTAFLTLRSPLWEHAIKKIIRSVKPDVLHVHDLLFVGPGLRLASEFDIPVVADLHENYPALLQIRQARSDTNALDGIIFNPRRFSRYEERVLPLCNYVITVVKEAADRIQELGVHEKKIIVVGNTEDVEQAAVMSRPEVKLPASELVLLYVGGLGPHRGLELVVKAMPEVVARIPSAKFVIVGDGTGRIALEALAQKLGVTDAVRFEGRQPFAKVYSYIGGSDVCLVPHRANPHTNATMPHKLFQYMYMKKPVIVSSAKPLARVVRDAEAGFVFESGDPDSLADCILDLQDAGIRRQMGVNGHRAVMNQYNWQHDAQDLIRLYRSLEQ